MGPYEQRSIAAQTSHLEDRALLCSDYSLAEVTLVYLRKKDPAGSNQLLFEVTELLTPWIEPGPTESRDIRLTGSSDFSLSFRRVQIPVSEGLERYFGYRSSRSVIIPEAVKGSSFLSTLRLGEEPAWPWLFTEPEGTSFWGAAPFWGRRPGGSRIQHLIPLDDNPLLNVLKPKELEKLRELLGNILPFNLFDRPIFIGSSHLVLTNPLFREIQHRISTSNPKQMNLRIVPHPGSDVSTLRMVLREIRPGGTAQVREISPATDLLTIDFGYEPHRAGFDVVCSRRGVLYSSEPESYISSIHINLGLVTGEKRVFVPSNPRGKIGEEYTVPSTSHHREIVAGSEPAPSAALRVLKDRLHRKESAQADEFWFDDVEAAKNRIRLLMATARFSALIVDPYFGAREFQSFALATISAQVKLKALSSAAFLKGAIEGASEEAGFELMKHVEHAEKQGIENKIEIRVMPGKQSDIHDRFLLIDEQVWAVGSSLGELGSRGTMIVRLRYPEKVQLEVAKIWDLSIGLKEFASGRSKGG